MKNYLKMTLFVLSALVLFLSVADTSAYMYNYGYSSNSDRFSYMEDLDGEDRGFRVDFASSNPEYVRGYTYCDDYGYYDWSYGSKNCRRSHYYSNRPYYPDQVEDEYDKDKVLNQAFRTYQQNSKQQFQIETQRINLAERRRYSGYGYGYSGARYYSYGW